jgi:hypothetical protein
MTAQAGPSSVGDGARKKGRRSLPFRLARALIVALLAIGLFYVVAMNVFLSTSLFARVIDGQPDVIDIHFGRGWSLVPGHIHAKNLSIRGRDGNVEWMLRLDEVVFDVSLRALAQQRFEASHVYGRGISFRARQRLDAPPDSLADVANLPPIEGLGPYAVRPPPHAQPERWSDTAYHLWTGHLEDVVAEDVREVWIDSARFEGSARIAGRFYLKPVRRAEIGPIRIDVHEGHVSTGPSVVVERLAGATADLTVAPFDPRTAGGMDIVRAVSLVAGLHPMCPDIDRLPLPLPAGMAITGALDARQLVLNLRGGALRDGTKVDATLPHGIVTFTGGESGEHRFTAALAVAGGVTRAAGEAGREQLDFGAQLTDLDVARTSDSSSPVGVFLHVPRTTVTGDARALDLADMLADVHLSVDVAEGELPDVRALSVYIPATTPLALQTGTGRVSVHLETWRAEKRAAGHANLRVERLGLRLGKMRVQGEASAEASVGQLLWDTSRTSDVKLALQVSGGALASEQSPAVLLVRLANLRVETRAAEVDLQDPLRKLAAAIVIDAGEVVAPDLLGAYLPKASEMHILLGKARFSLGCELTLENHLARGTLDVSSERFGFSFRDFRVAVDLRVKARVHDWQWERGDLALDQAGVDVTHVSVYRPEQGSGSGQGDVPAPPACVDCSPSPPATPALSFARILLGARSPHFAFSDPLAQVALSASLVDARVHDSASVNAFLPTGVPFLIRANEGSFSSDIQAEIEKHVLKGTIVLRAKGMGIGGKAAHIEGDIDVLARVSDWDLAENTLDVEDAHVLFSHVTGGFRGARADHAVAAPAIAPASDIPGTPARADNPDFRADQVELWASTPTLDLVTPSLQNIDGRVAIVGAVLPDATVIMPLMSADPIVAVEFGGARVSGDLEMSSTRRTAHGKVDVDMAHTGIRFHETHLAGDFKVSAQILGYDPDLKRFDVSGTSFAMRDVQVTNASTDTSRWAGDVAFKEASLRLDPDPELDGKLTVEARDASPILAILLGNGLPKIFVGLTRMPHLSGAARLTMGSHYVALRDLNAHGGDISIEGIYVVGQKHRSGAFVVGKGPFSAGFRLDDGGAHLRLFGLKSWLQDQTRTSLRLLDEPLQAAPIGVPAAAGR